MRTVLQPWQILVAAMSGWLTRLQQAVAEYLREENCILKEQLGRRRLRLTDAERRRLAIRGKAVGHRGFMEIASIDPSLFRLTECPGSADRSRAFLFCPFASLVIV